MDRRTAKILALIALIDEAQALADNGDILPDWEAREEMGRLIDALVERVHRLDGWRVHLAIMKEREQDGVLGVFRAKPKA